MTQKQISNLNANATTIIRGKRLLAFRTIAFGITSNVWAETRGKARWATVLAARDAGYRCEMTDVRCKRAPGLDNAMEADRYPIKKNRCYNPKDIFR